MVHLDPKLVTKRKWYPDVRLDFLSSVASQRAFILSEEQIDMQ
jgi:hypothetical protein